MALPQSPSRCHASRWKKPCQRSAAPSSCMTTTQRRLASAAASSPPRAPRWPGLALPRIRVHLEGCERRAARRGRLPAASTSRAPSQASSRSSGAAGTSTLATRATMPPACKGQASRAHYYERGSDPWNQVKYTPNGYGVADIEQHVAGFSMHDVDSQPVFGRTVVFHVGSAKVGCGVIGGLFGVTSASRADLQVPQRLRSYSVKGLAVVRQGADGRLVLRAVLTGLEPRVTAGIHIHEGFGCLSSSGGLNQYSGGHYYTGLGFDPWTTTTYTSDRVWGRRGGLSVADFSLEGTRPVAERTIVVHYSSRYGSSRAACGVITPSNAEVAMVSTYPEFDDLLYALRGMVVVSPTSTGSRYEGVLTGLEASQTGGWHVHSGFSCASKWGVGGHYFPGMQTDPWLVTKYTSNALGVARFTEEVADITLHRTRPVYGRAVVVHLSALQNGARAGCGVIGGATASAYPGVVPAFVKYASYAGQFNVHGTLALYSVPGTYGVRIHGVLAGLEPSATGGIHIHSGYGCSATSRRPRQLRWRPLLRRPERGPVECRHVHLRPGRRRGGGRDDDGLYDGAQLRALDRRARVRAQVHLSSAQGSARGVRGHRAVRHRRGRRASRGRLPRIHKSGHPRAWRRLRAPHL